MDQEFYYKMAHLVFVGILAIAQFICKRKPATQRKNIDPLVMSPEPNEPQNSARLQTQSPERNPSILRSSTKKKTVQLQIVKEREDEESGTNRNRRQNNMIQQFDDIMRDRSLRRGNTVIVTPSYQSQQLDLSKIYIPKQTQQPQKKSRTELRIFQFISRVFLCGGLIQWLLQILNFYASVLIALGVSFLARWVQRDEVQQKFLEQFSSLIFICMTILGTQFDYVFSACWGSFIAIEIIQTIMIQKIRRSEKE